MNEKNKTSGGYLIISVRQLNQLVKKARQVSKNNYNNKIIKYSTISVDLIINDDKFWDVDGQKQVNLASDY